MTKKEKNDFITKWMLNDDVVALQWVLNKDIMHGIADIVFDDDVSVNIRAHAAKIIFIGVGNGIEVSEDVLDSICGHKSSLIRLGAVIGLGHTGDIRRLELFLSDEHERIRTEAKEIIDEKTQSAKI